MSITLSLIIVTHVCYLVQAAGRGQGVIFERIVGGDYVDSPLQYPSIVHFNFLGCAGVVVAPTWILTAAHCVIDKTKREDWVVGKTITAGEFDLEKYETHEQRRTINLAIPHPSYNKPVQKANDIAMIRIEPPFQFNEYVKSVNLPSPGLHFDEAGDNFTGWVVGWGRQSFDGNVSHRLMHVQLPILPKMDCFSRLDGELTLKYDIHTMVCAGPDVGGKDSCQGDSGGPLFYKNITNDGNLILLGLVSWGVRCAEPMKPGVYSRVTQFLKWIQETMANPNASNGVKQSQLVKSSAN